LVKVPSVIINNASRGSKEQNTSSKSQEIELVLLATILLEYDYWRLASWRLAT